MIRINNSQGDNLIKHPYSKFNSSNNWCVDNLKHNDGIKKSNTLSSTSNNNFVNDTYNHKLYFDNAIVHNNNTNTNFLVTTSIDNDNTIVVDNGIKVVNTRDDVVNSKF